MQRARRPKASESAAQCNAEFAIVGDRAEAKARRSAKDRPRTTVGIFTHHVEQVLAPQAQFPLLVRAEQSDRTINRGVAGEGPFRLRDECLNETLFTSLAHARFVLAAWRHNYNTVRPHSKLGGKTPAEIAGQRVWGHAHRHVAIPSNNHHEGARLYL